MNPARRDHGEFLGLPLWTAGAEVLVERVCELASRETFPPAIVTYLNAHTTNLAFRSPDFRRAVLASAACYPDGMAVVRAARRRGVPVAERVNAGDFFPELLAALAAQRIPAAFVGSSREVVAAAADAFARTVPGLRIVHASHGHFAPHSDEERQLSRTLRSSGARIVFVGRGSPLQEEWAMRCGPETGARVIWCVGALLEYFAGRRRRAPAWMRRSGLEWLFRLALEPRRLAVRYLLGNVEFLWRVARGKAPTG